MVCCVFRKSSGQIDIPGAEFSMQLVSFLAGTKDIYVNPEEVSSIEENTATKTRIHLNDGTTYTVDMAVADVAAKLATDIS